MGLTVHEFAHAFTADRLGDRTAREQGRVTLNPLEHIDFLGFVMLILAGFGWAKPVMFNPARLRKPGRDARLIAMAGPLSNAVLALVLTGLFVALGPVYAGGAAGVARSLLVMLQMGIVINWGLFVFNLLPLPPLDGSHLFLHELSERNPGLYLTIQRYGAYILVAFLILGRNLDPSPLGAAVAWLYRGGLALFGQG